jgi:hypothetical protein
LRGDSPRAEGNTADDDLEGNHGVSKSEFTRPSGKPGMDGRVDALGC